MHSCIKQQDSLADRLVRDGTGLHCCDESKSVPYLGGVQHQMFPLCDNLCGWSVISSHLVRLMVA